MSAFQNAAAIPFPSTADDSYFIGTVAQTVIHVDLGTANSGFLTIHNDSDTLLYWAFSKDAEVDIDPSATSGATRCFGPIPAHGSEPFWVPRGVRYLNLVRGGTDSDIARVRRS